jgi:type VI secretion system secreted protein Hcp
MATGQASGKRQHSPIVITKEWGAASPQLFEALTANEVFGTVLVEFVETRRTGAEEVYQTISLTNATVSGMRMLLAEPPPGEPADNRALEDVSFTFQREQTGQEGSHGRLNSLGRRYSCCWRQRTA